jgi:hypothetical protein
LASISTPAGLIVTDDDLISFIAAWVGSIWTLELLLLLKREPRPWDAKSMILELRSSRGIIEDGLQTLQNAGFLTQDHSGRYRFHAASSQLNDIAAGIEALYRTKPTFVIKAITEAHHHRRKTISPRN